MEHLTIGEKIFLNESISDYLIQQGSFATVIFLEMKFTNVDFSVSYFGNCIFKNCKFENCQLQN